VSSSHKTRPTRHYRLTVFCGDDLADSIRKCGNGSETEWNKTVGQSCL